MKGFPEITVKGDRLMEKRVIAWCARGMAEGTVHDFALFIGGIGGPGAVKLVKAVESCKPLIEQQMTPELEAEVAAEIRALKKGSDYEH
jgi:hypothetical protein